MLPSICLLLAFFAADVALCVCGACDEAKEIENQQKPNKKNELLAIIFFQLHIAKGNLSALPSSMGENIKIVLTVGTTQVDNILK